MLLKKDDETGPVDDPKWSLTVKNNPTSSSRGSQISVIDPMTLNVLYQQAKFNQPIIINSELSSMYY